MANSLNVFVGGSRAATLEHEEGVFRMSYDDRWAASADAFPFSPHLRLGVKHEGASVRNFFSNLMPEGQALDGVSRAHQVSKFDVFGVLKKIGADIAGALVILPDGEEPGAEDQYRPVPPAELSERIRNQDQVPLIVWDGKVRISLPGVQNKIAVKIEADDSIWLPIAAAPSSHILKPETTSQQFPFLPENEYFCMRLAAAVGLPVAPTRLLQLPESVLVVDRYDRVYIENRIIRIHQIDLCQVLNLPPEAKYEQSEVVGQGAALRDLFNATQLLSNPTFGRAQLLDWVIFNYVIGNTDAHAKNVSFLVEPGSFRVAPAYDLLCGTVYGAKHFAQEIGDNDEIGLITAADWLKFAEESNLQRQLLQMQIVSIANRILAALEDVSAFVSTGEPAADLIQSIIRSIRQHADWALAAADDISKLSRPSRRVARPPA